MEGKTRIRRDRIVLQGSPRGLLSGARTNPQPLFRDPVPDLPVAGGDGFPENKRAGFGRETGFRILPYTLQDRYNRELEDLELPVILLENDLLKAELIPSLGGRLWSLFDKTRGRDILYRNPVFRPANLAIRDAWFSGGIEWNIGRLGHTAHTCAPVFAGALEDSVAAPGGRETARPVLRLWEFERQTRLFWRIEFILAENAPVLYAYVRVENPDPETKPLYWWTNAAVPQTPGVRVLSATDELIYFIPGTGKVKTMGGAVLPDLPTLPGADASYPAASTYSNEYFFQNDIRCGADGTALAPYPWESAVYEDGYAYAEAATAPLLYRKMFCWGSGPGGRRWQDYLSLPGEEYLEVQAGLAPTQLHTAEIAGQGLTDWVQAFTALNLDSPRAHQKDYRAAAAYTEAQLLSRIAPADLDREREAGRRRGDIPVRETLALGSGWGALEARLRRSAAGPETAPMPPGLSFPEESIGDEERPWLELLTRGALPLRDPADGPGSFVIQSKGAPAASWERLLRNSPGREGDWLTPYHLGVIALEQGESEGAQSFWEQSLKGRENPWAYRNLATACRRKGDPEAALALYRKIFARFTDAESGPLELDRSFAEEYVSLLVEQHKEAEAAAFLDSLSAGASGSGGEPAAVIDSGPLTDALARLAFARRDDALLDRIFSREPVHIREGDNTLSELWISREIRRLSEGEGVPLTEAEERIRRQLAWGKLSPPREIDFRMFTR